MEHDRREITNIPGREFSLIESVIEALSQDYDVHYTIQEVLKKITDELINSSCADFRFIGKSKKFRIAIPSLITRVSLCQLDFAVISILYSMPRSDFSVPISINRFVSLPPSFYTEHHVLIQWQGLENSFRNSLSLLSEILSNILNILHLELKLNHIIKKIDV